MFIECDKKYINLDNVAFFEIGVGVKDEPTEDEFKYCAIIKYIELTPRVDSYSGDPEIKTLRCCHTDYRKEVTRWCKSFRDELKLNHHVLSIPT